MLRALLLVTAGISWVWAASAAAEVTPCPDDDVACWVRALDEISSVYAPEVERIASFGESAVPFVLPKLRSNRRVTALAAAWILRELGSVQPVPDLVRMATEGGGSEVLIALDFILTVRRDLCRGMAEAEAEVDPDRQEIFQQMLNWAVSGSVTLGETHAGPFPDGQLVEREPSVVVSSEEMNGSYVFDVGRDVLILDRKEEIERAIEHGDYAGFRFHDVRIYEVSPPVCDTDDPTPVDGIDGVAVVSLSLNMRTSPSSRRGYLCGGGAKTIWFRIGGRWVFRSVLGTWIS